MRKRTLAVVSLASAASIATSWAAGLQPKKPTLQAGVTVSSGQAVVSSDPPTSKGSSSSSSSSTGSKESGAKPALPRTGRVDGAPVDTRYGTVQVRIRFSGKKITDVRALHLTDSSGTSVAISSEAAPILRDEALSAQSAQIDVVSGATYTSEAYQQSLQSAIDAAHLG